MRKMLFTFLICLFCAGSINAQDITGNYQIDSVSLTYTWFTRPMEQLGTDGNLHIAKVDTMLAGYEVAVHFHLAQKVPMPNIGISLYRFLIQQVAKL